MAQNQEIYTTVLTNGVLTITDDMGIVAISIQLVSGSGFFKGNKKLGGSIASNPIPLLIGVAQLITSGNGLPLNDIIIDCSAGGEIHIMAR